MLQASELIVLFLQEAGIDALFGIITYRRAAFRFGVVAGADSGASRNDGPIKLPNWERYGPAASG